VISFEHLQVNSVVQKCKMQHFSFLLICILQSFLWRHIIQMVGPARIMQGKPNKLRPRPEIVVT
jgi:hypothetical protein